MARYEIYEGNFKSLEKKLNKIEKKCSEYGCLFQYDVVETVTHYEHMSNGKEYPVRYVVIDVVGKAIVNDWEYIGTIQHLTNGNIITQITECEIPQRYYSAPCECEHCKSVRLRNYTYLVRNTKTGEFKQLGKTCLKDYTNGLDAELVAQYESAMHSIKSAEDVDEEFYFENRTWFSIKSYLPYVAECITKIGFIKSGDANYELGVIPTWKDALTFMDYAEGHITSKFATVVEKRIEKYHIDLNSEKSHDLAMKSLEWIRNTTDDHSYGYMNNLWVMCGEECVEERNLGLLASLIPTYSRTVSAIAESTSDYVGKVNDKITVNVKSMRLLSTYENGFGVNHLYKFTDADGNEFVWRTHKSIDTEVETLIGTIKEFNEFRGIKQTVLTRCKFS